jgi:hypothetical protein
MKIVAFTLIFAFTLVTAFAQNAVNSQQNGTKSPSKTIEQRAQEVTTSMAKHLRLTPDQVKKVAAINLTNMQHLQKAIETYKNDGQKLAAQVDVINQSRLSQIKDVLTQQQFTQYQQRREEKLGVPKEMQSNPAARQQESAYQQEN